MKILIIDDDIDVTAMLCMVLKKFDYIPVTAADGKRGLEIIRDHPDIRLVLLDWMLPGVSGLDVLRTIRAQEAPPPVIVVSARKSKEDVVSAIRAGAADYIIKPINAGRLMQKIQGLLAHHAGSEDEEHEAHHRLSMEAYTATSIVDISTTGVALICNFPVERDAIIFLESDEMTQRLGLDEDESLPVRVANCVKVGSRYRIGAQFICLPKIAEENLKRLCQG